MTHGSWQPAVGRWLTVPSGTGMPSQWYPYSCMLHSLSGHEMGFALVARGRLPSAVRRLFSGAAFLALGTIVASAQGAVPSSGIRLNDFLLANYYIRSRAGAGA